MISKVCFKCNVEKGLDEFYVHKKMKDGHLNKCKLCTKGDTKQRHDILISNNEWHTKEKERHRNKYYRLGYKDKHKPTSEEKKETIIRYKGKYPEKTKAKSATARMKKQLGYNLHHWSYNKEHYKDVIELPKNDHYFLHRHIIYDQERMMYRRVDNMQLLDTREKHIEFFNHIKQNLPF